MGCCEKTKLERHLNLGGLLESGPWVRRQLQVNKRWRETKMAFTLKQNHSQEQDRTRNIINKILNLLVEKLRASLSCILYLECIGCFSSLLRFPDRFCFCLRENQNYITDYRFFVNQKKAEQRDNTSWWPRPLNIVRSNWRTWESGGPRSLRSMRFRVGVSALESRNPNCEFWIALHFPRIQNLEIEFRALKIPRKRFLRGFGRNYGQRQNVGLAKTEVNLTI